MSTPRNYNLIDAADELRRIGPQIGAAIRELDRLCERLPMRLVERIEAAVPEIVHFDANTGARLSALAQEMAAEVDDMSDVHVNALCEQIEARRRAQREGKVVRGLAFGDPTRPMRDGGGEAA
jgi:hypothetical protein